MGVCLATDPDLLAVPDFDLTTPKDLPLWRGTPVEIPDWPETSEANDGPKIPRHFWRVIVAQWPIESRQQWGDRANQLQDSGFDWKNAERIAFEEILGKHKPSRS